MNIETLNFRKTNLREAIRMVEALKPTQFVPNLRHWNERPSVWRHIKSLATTGHTCGTLACFGGWLPRDEYFKGLGVFAGPDNVPMRVRDGSVYGFMLAVQLFGNHSMFEPASAMEQEVFGDERTIVLERLNAQLYRVQQRIDVGEWDKHQARQFKAIKDRQEAERIHRQASAFVARVTQEPPTRDIGHVS